MEDVDDRALHALAIELKLGEVGLRDEDEVDLAVAFAEEDECLLDDRVEVLRRVLAGRHPGEGGELVHEHLQLLHLLDDRAGALVEHGAAVVELAGVAAAEPLGGELDGRQGVLDLVGNAPRHLAPRFHALDAEEVRHFLEEDYEALRAAGIVEQPGAGEEQRHVVTVALEPHLPLDGGRASGWAVEARRWPERDRVRRPVVAVVREQARAQLADLGIGLAGEHLVERPPDARGGAHVEERLGGAVKRRDAALGIGRDDAGGDVGEQDLEVAAAGVELGATGL